MDQQYDECLDIYAFVSKINPFLEQNPDFPSDILGYTMTTYYGGRSEVKIRKQPTKVKSVQFLGYIYTPMKPWTGRDSNPQPLPFRTAGT